MINEGLKTILLVEDEAILAMAEKRALEKYGYAVRTVASGEKAVEAVRTSPEIDLVLMDINLGEGLDGTQTADIILKDRDVPLLFLSSHSEREVVEKTERITSYGYVLKNSSITVLDASIKMAFKLFDANKSIRNTEAKQNTMISNISDVIGIIDVEGIIKYKSTNIEKWFGWKPEELVGTDGWLTVHPDDLAWVKNEFFALLLNGGSSKNIEYRYKCKDGSYKPIELTATNLVDDPNINGVLMNYRDITERYQSGELLRENEERYRTLFESMPIGVFYFRPDGNIIFANAFAADILGITLEEITKRQHTDPRWKNIHEDGSEYPAVQLPSSTAMRTGKPVRNKIIGIYNQRENAYRWVRGTAIPQFRASEASPYQVFVTMEDITERKKIEEAFHEREESLSFILKGSNLGYSDNDLRTGTIMRNERWAEMLGFTLKEIADKNIKIKDLIHPEDVEEAERMTREHLQGKTEYYRMKYRLRGKDGAYRWILDCGRVEKRDSNGKPMRICGTHQDITEEMEHRDKIESLLSEKELILKEVHHRIKNNLNSISSLLILQADTVTEPSAVSALKDAEGRVSSLMRIYDKLYLSSDFSSLPVRDFLPILIDEIVANFPNNHLVKVEKHIEEFVLNAKCLQPLGIIINELLTNIMKYAFVGRESGLIAVSAGYTDGNIVIAIQDNGKGIPESISLGNSTGFGLQLVKALAEQLGGEILLERLNGTKFILKFQA